jgi:hypothetical protein
MPRLDIDQDVLAEFESLALITARTRSLLSHIDIAY